MKLEIKKGTESKLIEIFISDSSSTTGAGLTGLVYNTANLIAYYYRSGAANAVEITLADMTLGTWASGGFKVIDATNMPGWYQLGLPNAALVSGADQVVVHLKGATNMAPLPIEIQLVNYDPNDSVRMGMTALPNAAADGVGGLPISDAGGLDMDTLMGRLDAAISTRQPSGNVTVGTNNDKTGYGLADDAITASKFDQSTAFPANEALAALNLDHLIPVASTVSDASPTTTDFDTALTEASDQSSKSGKAHIKLYWRI